MAPDGGLSVPSPRATTPPWHLWGNTQQIVVPADLFTNPNQHEQQITLCRVEYGRPETWRWLLSARLLRAPNTAVGQQANASVWFEVLAGLGRANLRIPFFVTFPLGSWNGGAAPPLNLVSWTTKAQHSLTTFSSDSTGPPPVTWTTTDLTDLIVADHLTIVAHAVFNTDIPPPVQPIIVEVNGLLAPNSHVRPDWYMQDVHEAEQFPGGETGGR